MFVNIGRRAARPAVQRRMIQCTPGTHTIHTLHSVIRFSGLTGLLEKGSVLQM